MKRYINKLIILSVPILPWLLHHLLRTIYTNNGLIVAISIASIILALNIFMKIFILKTLSFSNCLRPNLYFIRSNIIFLLARVFLSIILPVDVVSESNSIVCSMNDGGEQPNNTRWYFHRTPYGGINMFKNNRVGYEAWYSLVGHQLNESLENSRLPWHIKRMIRQQIWDTWNEGGIDENEVPSSSG